VRIKRLTHAVKTKEISPIVSLKAHFHRCNLSDCCLSIKWYNCKTLFIATYLYIVLKLTLLMLSALSVMVAAILTAPQSRQHLRLH